MGPKRRVINKRSETGKNESSAKSNKDSDENKQDFQPLLWLNDDVPDDDIKQMGKYSVLKCDLWSDAYVLARRKSDKNDSYEYFVHFIDHDKRMNCWLPSSNIEHIKDSKTITKKVSNKKSQKNEDKGASILKMSNADLFAHVKFTTEVEIDDYIMETWYTSTLSGDYGMAPKLWFCRCCFLYFQFGNDCEIHEEICKNIPLRGKCVYRNNNLSIYEIDGLNEPQYCQRLCQLGKLFISSKITFWALKRHMFYVLYRFGETIPEFIGYFSKKKLFGSGENLYSIVILPPYQRKGFGHLLISFSYELTKICGLIEEPRKPLSDIGHRAYRSYWSWVILTELNNLLSHSPGAVSDDISISVDELSKKTAITRSDIFDSMNWMKLWDHTENNNLIISNNLAKRFLEICKVPKMIVNREAVHWTSQPNT